MLRLILLSCIVVIVSTQISVLRSKENNSSLTLTLNGYFKNSTIFINFEQSNESRKKTTNDEQTVFKSNFFPFYSSSSVINNTMLDRVEQLFNFNETNLYSSSRRYLNRDAANYSNAV